MIKGQGGNDTISYDDGHFLVKGGAGNDSISGGSGSGTISGGSGNDTLTGTTGAFSISGGSGNNSIWFSNVAGTVSGGDGADTISAGGHSKILGGAGSDSILIHPENDPDDTGDMTVKLGGGADTIVYQYTDAANNGQPDNPSGNLIVKDLSTNDVLVFNEIGANPLTEAEVEAASTVTDDGTNVTIEIATDGAGAVTIVLQGIGTGDINSIADIIAAGYELKFS